MRRQAIVAAPIGLVLVYLTMQSGCGQKHGGSSEARPPVVRVRTPLEKLVTEYVPFTGRTDAVDNIDVRAQVTGYLVEIKYKPGEQVEKGAVLFQIDERPYKAALDQAKAQVLLNGSTLKLAAANMARARELLKSGATSQEEFDSAVASEGQASGALESSRANVEIADLNLKFTQVKIPTEGIIGQALIPGRNLITVGNLVVQNVTPLTTVVSMDPMYAYFDVDERTMLRVQALIREGKFKGVKEGSQLKIGLGLANEGDDYPHEGTLDFVNNQVDTSTGTLQVRALLKNPPVGKNGSRRFTPGLFVRVRIPIGDERPALLVPQGAIGTDQGKRFVYVVNDQSTIEYRPVEAGPQQPGGMQVVDPIKVVRTQEGMRPAQAGEKGEDSLRATDQVVVAGLQRIRSGVKVEAKPAVEVKK
jgi:membrane fusion protein, multidrug efflux system